MRRPVVVRGRPGLIGTMARTAVVAGTATVTANAISNRSGRRQQQAAQEEAAQQAAQQAAADNAAQQAQIDQMQAQLAAQQPVAPAPAVPTAAPGAVAPDMMAQLNQLAQLKQQGVLSDAEFAAAKAKLLGLPG
ncbi:SHOCT domain-containing protein [Hamadaea tsunoensis]|uniref:SHOCT domain-containing protein n=1 Tax=Hamadaea tsunoensis TaxID=53368 RepID=UPI001B7FD7D9|nr:SHOCT domain-containing protein [Hamadaea tsunoensis]